jgi:hypothetical protein
MPRTNSSSSPLRGSGHFISVLPGSLGVNTFSCMFVAGTARKSGRDAPQPAAPVRAGVILDGAEEDDEEEGEAGCGMLD